MSSSRARRFAGFGNRLVPLAASAACVVALPAACAALHDALRTHEIVAGFDDPAPGARGDLLDRYFDTSPKTLSSDAAAALGEIAIESAGDARQSGLRRLYLGEAAALVRRVEALRPDWSIGQILAARLELARHGIVTPGAIRAFAASYRYGAFLRREAKWRIAFASLCWRSLDQRTRDAVIDEAVWMVRYDGNARPQIEDMLGDSPAGVSFQLRLARDSSP